jgi:hypothetical protein
MGEVEKYLVGKGSRLFLVALAFFILGGPVYQQEVPTDFEMVKRILVVASAAWTDTELEVMKGQELYFTAGGTVSLQKDNPVASCGPEGLSLKTMQQPLPEQSLGALIGKIREKVEVTEDKQTGEKTQREFGTVFFIGKENRVSLPSTGRLLLGINENVSGDNDGGFDVKIYMQKSSPEWKTFLRTGNAKSWVSF